MKKIILGGLVWLPLCGVFALPGIQDYVPTFSGEYVYYRDYTFVNETYIGFLQYDNHTYGLRYYAPDAESGSPEIELYITLNPEKDAVELSGEKIATAVTVEDVDTVNYLHDLMYELSARRKNENLSDFSKSILTSQEYYQFGGEVVLNFDFFVPIFNLRSITDEKGNPLLEAVSIGRLVDSADTAFFDYAPDTMPAFPQPDAQEKNQRPQAKPLIAETASQRLTLDTNWKPANDNVWALDEKSLLILDTMEIDEKSFIDTKFTFFDYAVRMFTLSSLDNYVFLPRLLLEKGPDSFRLENLFYGQNQKNFMRDIKILSQIATNSYSIMILTVYETVYQAEKDYFNGILQTLTVKKAE